MRWDASESLRPPFECTFGDGCHLLDEVSWQCAETFAESLVNPQIFRPNPPPRPRIIDRMVEKIGPYRVYERLGVGGMGEVYKAYDDKLERWVAIKRIRPDREDADDNRERFKREARATARLNHPSIVHLYGIFQDGDSDCIVMEYVEGETLDKKLVRDTLVPVQVATLGHEIASGLAEAHANGILHRDLKAENIIITPKGRSKILDFGLAKPILSGELDPVLTGKGQLVGTSRAMSPEYVGGESIDHRSDLFSLGVLLYECLTGQSPFKAHNTLATLKQVMLHKQKPIREINPDVPKELSDAIDRLLEKEPDNRPQSARDVSHTFATLSGELSSSGFERPNTASFFDATATRIRATAGKAFSSSETMLDLRPRRRWMTGLAVFASLLVVAFFLGRALDNEPEVAPLPEGERIRVVLGDFVNRTEEAIFDDSLQQAMRVDLEQSRFIETMSPSTIRETLSRMELPGDSPVDRETAVEIARREGAHRVVLGEIQDFGGTYSLLIQIVAPENDIATFSASEAAKSHEGILRAMQKLNTAVRRHLGESGDQIRESLMALEKVTTADFEALRAYTLGEDRMSFQKFDEAVPLFRRATELDPSFGMAHAKLVVAFSNLGDTNLAGKAALEAQKNSERLTEEERFYIDGWVARWLGTPQDVIDVWSLFRDLHPESIVGHGNLGSALWYYRNDFDSVAENFDRAIQAAQTPGEGGQAQAALGLSRLALGQLEAAEASLLDAGSVIEAIDGRVFLYSVRGQFDSATAAVAELEDPTRRARANQVVLTSKGELRLALQTTKSDRGGEKAQPPSGFELRKHAALSELSLAATLRDSKELNRAMILVTELTERSDLYSRNLDESTAALIAQAIKVLCRSGNIDRASALRESLRPTPAHAPALVRSLIKIADAELSAARGELDTAIIALKEAASLVETITVHESLGHLFRLHGDADAAIAEYQWVRDRPGLAYVECYLSCASVSNTISIWTTSLFRLAQLLEAESPDLAAESYLFFLERWGQTDIPEVEIARRRLTALSELN